MIFFNDSAEMFGIYMRKIIKIAQISPVDTADITDTAICRPAAVGITVPDQGFSENVEISRKHLSEVEGLAKVF